MLASRLASLVGHNRESIKEVQPSHCMISKVWVYSGHVVVGDVIILMCVCMAWLDIVVPCLEFIEVLR